MFPGVGWTELLLIAAMAIIVVGPRDLPVLMRRVGRFLGQARAMAREFQDSFDDIAREAELEELRKKTRETADSLRTLDVDNKILTPEQEDTLIESQNRTVLENEARQMETSADDMPLEPGGALSEADEPSPSKAPNQGAVPGGSAP